MRFQTTFNENGEFSSEEIETLEAILHAVFEQLEKYPTAGTYVLAVSPDIKSKKITMAARFHLANGEINIAKDDKIESSDVMTNDAIFVQLLGDDKIENGLKFFPRQRKVLVLKMSNAAVICSCIIGDDDGSDAYVIRATNLAYIATAFALGFMRQNDEILQKSLREYRALNCYGAIRELVKNTLNAVVA